MKCNKFGMVGSTEKNKQSKGHVPVRPSLLYYRGTLGEPLTPPFPKFDLWDPNMHLTDWTYSSLHDAHLKSFFSQPNKKRLLIKLGLITHDDKVLCSQKDFSKYMNYIKTVQQSWEKLFVQKQKQLLKEFMLQQLRGQVPEHVTVSDMKEWLIYKERNTFRTIYWKFMKWSDPQCAELAWELSQWFQLEDLEKEVVRELQLKGQGLHNLEVLSHSSVARPGSPVEIFSISPSDVCKSTEEAASLVMTVENLHSYIRRITTSLMGEIKENLVPVLLEQLHDGCTTPRNSADSSSDFLPVYSTSQDMTTKLHTQSTSTVVSCRDSISPIISCITSEESCSSSLFSSANLSFSGYSTTSTDVITFKFKEQSSDSLQNVMSQSIVTDPAKFKTSSEDVCILDIPTVIPYFGGSANLLSPTNITDRPEDIESPTSRNSRNQSPLLAKSEMVVLEVLNHAVALLKSLPIRQKENGSYKDPDMQITDTDIQRDDTLSNIKEILSNLTSPSLSSLSSLAAISPLTESTKSCSVICHPSSSYISIISEDIVESSLERVISVLQIEGLLGPQHTSEEMNESSSYKSCDSDPASERAQCVSVGPTGSQCDSGNRLTGGHNGERSIRSPETERELEACTTEIIQSVVKSVMMTWSQSTSQSPSSHVVNQLSSDEKQTLSETLEGIRRKLSSEKPSELLKVTVSPENTDAIVELLTDMLRQIQTSPSMHSQHQDSPISLQCTTQHQDSPSALQRPSIMSSCPTLKDTKVQTAFEGLKSKLLAQNVQPVIDIIHKAMKEQFPCPVSEETRTTFTDLAEDIICSVLFFIAELSSDGLLAVNDEFAGTLALSKALTNTKTNKSDLTLQAELSVKKAKRKLVREISSKLTSILHQSSSDIYQSNTFRGVISYDSIAGCERTVCKCLKTYKRSKTCPSFMSTAKSDLRNTLRKILLTSCDSACTQSDQVNEEESSRNLASSLAHVVYQHLQDKCKPEIQISKTLDKYTTTKVDCSDQACSSEVKVISCPPSESVVNLLDRTFGNKAKTSNVVKSSFKKLTKPTLKLIHIQSQSDDTKRTVHKVVVEEPSAEGTLENSRCTIDISESPSSTKPVFEHYSDIVLRVVEITVTKVIMETFRLHRLSPESASLNQDFESFISSHPQHEFILWLRSSVMETILEQLFVPQKVTDVTDATRAENPAGTLGATEELVTEMPIIENTPVGSKPKKMKRFQAFFRRAWQAVKQTFSFGSRSNKISPDS